jgi:hypothetical protein
MFLKFHYRLSYENLCAEVSDSICWRRFRSPGPGCYLDGWNSHLSFSSGLAL